MDDTATLDERLLPHTEGPPESERVENKGEKKGEKDAAAAREAELSDLAERVHKHYGAFGERAQHDEIDDRVVFADNGWRLTATVIGGVFLASAFLWFASHPAFSGPATWANNFRLDSAFAVVWMPILFWAMARQKLQKSLRIYLALALFIEPFSEVMFREMGEGGYWDSVMWPSSVAFFGTLKEFAGVPGASFSTFLIVTVGLLWRAIHGRKSATYTAPPAFAKGALYIFLSCVLSLAVYGLLRGGQMDWTFRQTIHLIQLPLVALLFLYALRVPEDLAAVGTAYVIAALARSLLVMWVYFGVCVPQGITALPGKPEWCTNHSDSVLFVSALVILFAHALEQRTKKITLRALGVGAIILFAIILNNRRLAFVSLAIAPFVIYLALDPSKRKRRVTAALLVAAPVLAGYVLVGAEMGPSPIWKPAQSIVSVLDQKDASSQSRDIENENLIYTLQKSPIVMRGFGHEYDYSPANPPVDLTDTFKNFRIIAHNGVLWLWSIAGVLGFMMVWMVYPLAGTMAMRGYRAAQTPLERSAALAALGMVAVCVIQIWGDQGFSSYMTVITFGVAFAVASRLAVRQA